jgi:uncharacterized protein (TIGR00645 family)
VVRNGARWFTPLFLVLMLIETSDVIFAVDSIPAIFAVTTDPFIVFTSNIFAIMGLRSLYFLLADMNGRFHLLKYGLAMVLVFVGAKMLVVDFYKVPIGLALGVVALILSSSVAASLFATRKRRKESSAMKHVETQLEKFLFASRWLLVPFYLGLVLALALLLVKFVKEFVHFVPLVFTAEGGDVIIGVLTLVDVVMVANLLIIIVFAGYENFVSRFDAASHEDWPGWMGHVGFAELKMKLIGSIVAISGIELLKAFMHVESLTNEQLGLEGGHPHDLRAFRRAVRPHGPHLRRQERPRTGVIPPARSHRRP